MVSRQVVQILIFTCLLAISSDLAAPETGSAAFEKAISQSDFQIVPSEKRIGPIRLGMALDEVLKLLGRPEKVFRDPVGGLDYMYDEKAFHVGFTPGAVPRVCCIGVWDSRFALENGKHVGRFTSFDVARWYSKAEDVDAWVSVTFPSGVELMFYLRAKGDYTIVRVSMSASRH
jgi:hypothetical protein